MIAVCTPSRGLIFSRTVQCVIEGMQALNQLGVATKYYYTHNLPIPDCHNACIESALADSKVTKVVIVEEDMYADPETFLAVALADNDITLVNYNDRNGMTHGIMHVNQAGEILWSGLGMVSIKREVFEKIGVPYFRTDHMYKNTKRHIEDGKSVTEIIEKEPRQEWSEAENKFVEVRDKYKYGGLDVDFYTRARNLGFKPVCLEGYKAHQFELVKLGEKHDNNGCHVIKQV